MKILVFNCGSSSLKFQVIELDPDGRFQKPARGIIKSLGREARFEFQAAGGVSLSGGGDIPGHEAAVKEVIHWLTSTDDPSSGKNLREGIRGVGHRVVHGGSRFTAPVLIDDEMITEIEKLSDLAPLHNPACVNGIRAVRSALGKSVPMVAVFDTAFHHTLPEYASLYAIPYELSVKHRIKRYGFHGTAHRFMVLRYSEMTSTPLDEVRIITLQLGNGCSAAVIRNGRSVDTSMGLTPLEGLVMGTRSGDIDPAIIGYLAGKEGIDGAEVEIILNERSGLLGVSGCSNDMGALLERLQLPDQERVRLALDIYCYRIRKYIGAYLAVLGGADALVFSGGIGENSPFIRARVCEGMEWCGLRLDPDLNTAVTGREGRISAQDVGMHAYVIPVDEELLIAGDTADLLRKRPLKE